MNGKGSTWKKTLLNIKKWVVERKVTECGVFPMSDHLWLPIWSQYANVKWNLDEDDDVKWNCDDDNDGDNVIPMMAYCDHLFVTSSPTAMSLTARTHTLWSNLWQIRVFTWCVDRDQDQDHHHHSDSSVDVTAYPHIPNSDQTQIPNTRQASRHQTPGTHQTAVVHGGEGRMENPDSSTADSSVKGASIGSDDWDVPETNIEMNPEHIEMYLGILRCTWCNFLERLPHEYLDLKSCSWVHVPIFKPCTTFTTPAP